MKEVKDDYSNAKITVKDYNKIGAITYIDVNGTTQKIADPSAYFGLYTNTYEDSNPAYANDYDVLKAKVADLFPAIKSGQESQGETWKTTGNKNIVIEINRDLKEKIAKFFPAIEVGMTSNQGETWKTTGNINKTIKIESDVFYIDKSSNGEI